MKKIIVGENLSKEYGEGSERRKVLNEVSIKIEQGEFITIMGPSGCGKSTLLSVLSGLERPEYGTVSFLGSEINKMKEAQLSDLRRKNMGFVYQQPTLLKNLNLIDNIMLPAVRKKQTNAVSILKKARELMKKTGISDLEERYVNQVSGGQLQRAGICRALINQPEILFGDEPTGALNSKSAEEVMKIFSEINQQGTTVLLVTHDAKVAAYTDKVYFMQDGHIVNEIEWLKSDQCNVEEKKDMIRNNMKAFGI